MITDYLIVHVYAFLVYGGVTLFFRVLMGKTNPSVDWDLDKEELATEGKVTGIVNLTVYSSHPKDLNERV